MHASSSNIISPRFKHTHLAEGTSYLSPLLGHDIYERTESDNFYPGYPVNVVPTDSVRPGNADRLQWERISRPATLRCLLTIGVRLIS